MLRSGNVTLKLHQKVINEPGSKRKKIIQETLNLFLLPTLQILQIMTTNLLMLKHTEEIIIHFSEQISDEPYSKSYR